MLKISVIIPFYQARDGILRRAVKSVLTQHVPEDTLIDVIVVDDGSPVSAILECDGLELPGNFTLRVVTQHNGGVSKARNQGLDVASPDCQYIAFLDSDDIWEPRHLRRAIEVLETGYDFYFCDHSRRGRYSSHLRTYCSELAAEIEASPQGNLVADVPRERMILEMLDSFPTNSSTVLYRRSVAPNLRFNDDIRCAGEDILFQIRLVLECRRVCCDLCLEVECADGLNMFFSHYDQWDSPARLEIAYDRVVVHEVLQDIEQLPPSARERLKKLARIYRRDLVFFAIRHLLHERKWPKVLNKFATRRPFFAAWVIGVSVQILTLRALRLYEPF